MTVFLLRSLGCSILYTLSLHTALSLHASGCEAQVRLVLGDFKIYLWSYFRSHCSCLIRRLCAVLFSLVFLYVRPFVRVMMDRSYRDACIFLHRTFPLRRTIIAFQSRNFLPELCIFLMVLPDFLDELYGFPCLYLQSLSHNL